MGQKLPQNSSADFLEAKGPREERGYSEGGKSWEETLKEMESYSVPHGTVLEGIYGSNPSKRLKFLVSE